MEIDFTHGKVGQREGEQLVPLSWGVLEERTAFNSLLSPGL